VGQRGKKLGQMDLNTQEWLMLTPLDNDDRPTHTEKELFPRPPKREDGSYVYDRVPDYCLPQKEKESRFTIPVFGEIDPPLVCIRRGCSARAVESPEWDDEYCSNKCAVAHCGDAFADWALAQTAAAAAV